MSRPFESDTTDAGTRSFVLQRRSPAARTPRRYRVILHNDDYTTMDFVVDVLVSIFHKEESEAVGIMLRVHRHGTGEAGEYPREVAETRVDQVTRRARQEGFPLLCTMEACER